jgi:hypothetical protein
MKMGERLVSSAVDSPCPVPENQSNQSNRKKGLVLIILVIVFPHQIKIQKRHGRIHSTVKVIRACLFIMLSVQEVTQRVPPTCIIKTSRTNVNAVAGFQPFFADDHLKPLDGAGKGV